MLKAYGLRIALFALGGLLAGLIMSLTMQPKYEAIMQVMVDQSPVTNSRMMTPAEQSVRDILEAPRSRSVATQVEQLTGYGVLQRASQAVHAKYGKPYGAIKELNIMDLQRAISVEAANTSDIITLTVRMPDKQLAEDVANEIYLAYDAQNQESSREVGARALAYLETQTGQVKRELNKVDGDMASLQKTYGMPAVDLQVQSEIQTLRGLDESMEQARIEYAAATAQAAAIKSQLANVKPVIQTAQQTGVNGNYQRLEAALADAQNERAQLLTQWKEGSPAINAVDEKISAIEKAMKGTPKNILSGTQTSNNPLYQTLSAEAAQAEARARAAEQRIAAASAAVSSKRSLLTLMPDVQRKMQDLKRQQDSLTQTYMSYKDTMESLKVAQRGRTTQSTLVSPAFVNPKPVAPNTTLNLGAGLLAGLLLGVLASFQSESKKSPIRNLTHLNRLAFEPSFRTIPELPMASASLDRMPNDSFVALLGNFIRSAKRPYKLGVIGVDPHSGASTAAAALVAAATLDGRRALLVDSADKNGSSARLGTSDLLTVIKTTDEGNASAKADDIEFASADRELCVFDLQPYRTSGNPMLFASDLDECILLVRAGRTRSVDFLQAQQMLLDAGVPQVTVVLSRAKGLDDDFSFVEADTPALVAR
jgi:succinoglycan biosynthesis transport protein ExoP